MATEQQEKTPLGQRVDKAVWDLVITVREHVDVDAIGHKKWNHCDVCLIARHRLENAIRARMSEYKAEGYPERAVSAIMDTRPENLLKLERLSNTVYVLLGHRDPDKLAAWINQAHAAADRTAEHISAKPEMKLGLPGGRCIPIRQLIERLGTANEHSEDRERLCRAIENMGWESELATRVAET